MAGKKKVYRFEPVGLDRWTPHSGTPKKGTLVRKCQPYGCPPNGTMGHCYVEDLDGKFLGLVMLNSLQLAKPADLQGRFQTPEELDGQFTPPDDDGGGSPAPSRARPGWLPAGPLQEALSRPRVNLSHLAQDVADRFGTNAASEYRQLMRVKNGKQPMVREQLAEKYAAAMRCHLGDLYSYF